MAEYNRNERECQYAWSIVSNSGLCYTDSVFKERLPFPTPIPLPTTLVHRTERWMGLVSLGLVLAIIGGWMILAAAPGARLRVLRCERGGGGGAACEAQSLWLGVALRAAPVEVQGAEVGEEGGGYRLFLITPAGTFPFSNPTAGPEEPQAMADQINRFLGGAAEEPLTIQAGGEVSAFLSGMLGSIFLAGGFVLAAMNYRRVVRPAHTHALTSLAFSPDGQLLASAAWEQTIQLWQMTHGAPLRTLTGHVGPVTALAFRPDGQTLASAGWDQTIRLWRLPEGLLLGLLTGHTEPVNCLAVSADGHMLASGSLDQTIRLWHGADGALWRVLRGHAGPIEDLAFTPDGHLLISASADRSVRFWQVADGRCVRVIEHPEAVTCLVITLDGQFLATGSTDPLIRLWRLPAGELQRQFAGHTGWVRSLAFVPGSRKLVSAATDHTLRLWSLEAEVEPQILAGHAAEVTCLAVSPDGQVVASGSADQTVRLWPLPRL